MNTQDWVLVFFFNVKNMNKKHVLGLPDLAKEIHVKFEFQINGIFFFLKYVSFSILIFLLQLKTLGTSLVVQWLRLQARNAGGLGLIPA